jgi:D-threo-aldose 1-dehydrogenase
MRTTILKGTDVETSVLGFGSADLFRIPSSRQRQRVLGAAYDAGIRHFDAAPMYGLGLAEREFGRFARSRRNRIVIATKFGIAPTAVARRLAVVQGPVRRLFTAIPALRQWARASAAGPGSGAAGALLYTAQGYDAAAAEQSLKASLRELATDHVDLFLLHDPNPGDVRSDDVRAYLEKAHGAGLIRAWGVAGEPGPSVEVSRLLAEPGLVLQIRDDVLLHRTSPPEPNLARITFGVMGRVLPRLLDFVTASTTQRQRWNDLTGTDCGDAQALASLLLRDALRANPSGVVLFSTTNAEHIRTAVEAAAMDPAAPDDALEAFRELVHEIPHTLTARGA